MVQDIRNVLKEREAGGDAQRETLLMCLSGPVLFLNAKLKLDQNLLEDMISEMGYVEKSGEVLVSQFVPGFIDVNVKTDLNKVKIQKLVSLCRGDRDPKYPEYMFEADNSIFLASTGMRQTEQAQPRRVYRIQQSSNKPRFVRGQLEKSAELKVYVDFQKLNKQTRADAYPAPRDDGTLDRLGGSKWFSTLDMAYSF
ncbi:hypothetical protein RF11_07517 [Thelohanellus kitauei]|uniref:Uncharacterized protein n=1 Tax=Thelohanellus kitauei TaxID=669202 RepID=A0A0C2M3J9_THEKT|nr:hypothetical protein RF11_07517 [Thelohanellus kitauei]